MASIDIPVQRFGGLSYDDHRRVLLSSSGESVQIRAQSLKIFCYLTERADTLVPRAELFSAVWGNTAVTDDSLIQCIADIRRVLGPKAHDILKTVPRRGYMLVADPVCETDDTAAGDRVVVPLYRRPLTIFLAVFIMLGVAWVSQRHKQENSMGNEVQAAAATSAHDNDVACCTGGNY